MRAHSNTVLIIIMKPSSPTKVPPPAAVTALGAVASVREDERVAAVIEVSAWDESPRAAVRSVLDNRAYFAEVHLVAPRRPSYAGWPDDRRALLDAGYSATTTTQCDQPYEWHSSGVFDANRVGSGVRAAFFIPADMQVTEAAVSALHDDMVNSGSYSPNVAHFAISSVTSIHADASEDGGDWRMNWPGIASYGFLLVLMMLDWMRLVFNLGKYHRTFDLRGEVLQLRFPRWTRRPERPGIMSWLWNRTTARAQYGDSALMHVPSDRDAGFAFVLRSIKTHAHMGAGLWILGFLVYYWFFAWPWWNPFVQHSSWTLVRVLGKTPFAWYWLTMYVAHTFAVGCLAWLYMDIPWLTAHVALYTVFLTLCPPLLVYGRFHVSRATWRRKKSGAGGKTTVRQ